MHDHEGRPVSGIEDADHPLAPGRIVHGTVIAHHHWGVDLALEEADVIGVVDLLWLSDDTADMNQERFPRVGERLTARVLLVTPNGQLRVTTRASDLSGAD